VSPSTTNLVFIGIKGTVLALDRATGRTVWESPLKGGTFVNLVLDQGDLIATTKGEVFCLDPANGRIRWNNPLRGFGWGLATVGTGGASSFPVMAQHHLEQEQAAAQAAASAGA
jgi:outer membrane protein assembly factor BamB